MGGSLGGSNENGLPVIVAIWLATGLCLGRCVYGWFSNSSICLESCKWWLEWSNSSSSNAWPVLPYKFGLLLIS